MLRNECGMRYFWGAMLSVLIFGLASAARAGTFDNWMNRMTIRASGSGPAGVLTNFPMLVVLSNNVGNSGFSYSGFASTNGADLRFAASNQTTELNYEIESWDTNGASYVWVQVSEMVDTNSLIYAFWGNEDATAPAYATNGRTWSEGYYAVWHMGETSPRDSTSNGLHTIGSGLDLTNGPMGRGLFFGASGKAAVSNAFAPTGGRFTVELWGLIVGTTTDRRPFESYTATGPKRLILRWNETVAGKTTYYDSGERPGTGCGSSLNNGNWQHLTYVLDQPNNVGVVYQAGMPVATSTWSMASLAGTATYLGASYNGGANYFNGGIDEMRFSTVTRSPGWVRATWLNMASNGDFQTYASAGLQATGLTVNALPFGSRAPTSVSANGRIMHVGNAENPAVYVCWAYTDAGINSGTSAWANVAYLGTNWGLGARFSTNLTGLFSGSNYSYRCYVTNSTGSDWSDSAQNFQTVYLPVITNRGPVNGSAATWLRGEVTDTGWDAPDTWIYWWADGAAVTTVVAMGKQSGVFSNAVSGLTPGVTYHYSLLASNAAGTLWSHMENFQTLAQAWYVATNGVAPNNGSKWSWAFTNLQDALNAAGQDDFIYLAGQSIAVTNQMLWTAKTNVTIQGGFAALNDAVLPGPYDSQLWPTVISRNPAYTNRLMVISNVLNGTLARVTLIGGYQTGGASLYGGGLYIVGSTGLVLSACVISSNGMLGASSSVYGGGLYAKSSVVVLSNCVVRGNNPDSSLNYVYSWGGGIYIDGGRMTLVNSTIANNRTSGSNADLRYGGGLYNNGAICALINCLVVGNGTDGRQGDGIYVAAGTQIVQNCTVAYNAGQGLYRSAGSVAVTNSIFWGNGDDITGAVTLAWSDIENGDSNGLNGCISTPPLFERGFYLGTNSLCMDTGTNDASVWGLTNTTVRADGSNDTGRVDMGYHYPTGFDLGGGANLYVATNGADGSNGMSWATAYRTITKALSVARDGTRVYIGSGTYDKNGLEIFPLTLNSLTGVQLVGTNRATTIINATTSSNRVLTLFNCANVRVSELTLTGGYQTNSTPSNYGGGAAQWFGGGVALWSCGGVEFTGCVIRLNRVAPPSNISCYGGGIYSRFSVLTLVDCLVNTNMVITSVTAASPRGAGIYLQYGFLTMRDSIITSNRCSGESGTGRYGAGLYNYGAACLLKNCLFAGNTSAGGNGDAIYQDNATGALLLDNCSLAYNVGQALNRNLGSVVVSNSIFWGNTVDIVNNAALFYCDLQSGLSNGINNCVMFDPLFADTNYFHLQSKQGVYTGGYFRSGGWSTSLTNSPAIDAGAPPPADYSREPAPNGSRVNMGYDGNSRVASLTDISSIFSLPVVTNFGATRIGHRTVRLNGAVTDTGGSVPDCTFAFWIVGSGVTSSVPLGLKNSAFFGDMTGLLPGSNYNCSFYAVNGAGGVWSDVKSFTMHSNPFNFYVSTNGDDTTGAGWSTAYKAPQTALSVMEQGDEVYLAGQSFQLPDQLFWLSSASYVRVSGAYAATNAADQPGPYNVTNWSTVLAPAFGVSNRILFITNVTSGTLERVTFAGGYRMDDGLGGGIHIVGSTGMVLSACVVSNNSVVVSGISVYGGGLYLKSSGVMISNCLVRANTATTSFHYPGAWGGGIYVDGGWVTVINSIVISNKVIGSNGLGRNGGGFCNENATCRLQNCLMWGNLADNSDGRGSGAGLYAASGVLSVDNCTVAYNNGGQGLTRMGSSIVAATNSIFWGNGDDLTGTMSVAYCDIQNANDTFWTNGITGCISIDPMFVNTSAADYSLIPGSPCINAGTRHPWMYTAYDLSGNKRILGASVDMGVYETTVAFGTIFIVH